MHACVKRWDASAGSLLRGPFSVPVPPSAGYLFEWGATALRKSQSRDKQDCSACVEIYWDVADVFSGTKINRVIYGDWFGFWKLISNGWSFLFFLPSLEEKLSNNISVMEPSGKASSLLCTKQAIQIPAFMKMGAACFYRFPLMLTRCSAKLRHGNLIQQLLVCSIQAPGMT